MKQYRPLLLIFTILIAGWTIFIYNACSQTTQLTQIQPSTVKWMLPVGKRVLPGQSGKWFQTYMSLSQLIDSTGTIVNPRDSTIIIGGWGITAVESPTNTWNVSVDSSKFATPYDLTLKENTLSFTSPLNRSGNTVSIGNASTSTTGALTSTDWNTFNNKYSLPSLTSGSVIFSNGTTLAQDNANFFYNSASKNLGIGTNSPSNNLDIRTSSGDASIYLGNQAGDAGIGLSPGTPYFGLKFFSKFGPYARALMKYTNQGIDHFELGATGDASGVNYGYLAAGTRNYTNPNAYFYANGKTSFGDPLGLAQEGQVSVNGNLQVRSGTGNLNVGYFTNNTGGGSYNTHVGEQVIGSGLSNVRLGAFSNYGGSGNYNVYIGEQVAYGFTGSNNIMIGQIAGLGSISSSASNMFAVGSYYSGQTNWLEGLMTPSGYLNVNSKLKYSLNSTATLSSLLGKGTDGYFREVPLSGLGIVGGTLTNTAPDQTVSITGSGATTVTGTYPNFTVSSTAGSGTVTSITAAAPLTGGTITTSGSIGVDTVSATGVATQYGLALKQDILNPMNGIEITGGFNIGNTKPFDNIRISANNGTQHNLVNGSLLNFNTTSPLTATMSSGNIGLGIGTASSANDGALTATDWNTFNNKFSLPTLTSGSVLFSNGSTIAQDNSNFFWDDVNNRLRVGQVLSGFDNGVLNVGGRLSLFQQYNQVIGSGAAVSTAFNNGSTYYNDIIGMNAAGGTSANSLYSQYLGYNSGFNNTGDYSVMIGNGAGYNNTGDLSILIGNNAGYNNTQSNSLFIDNTTTGSPLIGGRFDLDRVGINTAIGSIANTLHVTGGARVTSLAGSGNRMVIADAAGDLSTQAIPVAPQTWGDFGTNIQNWSATGTFGSGKDVGIGGQPTRDFDVNGDARLRGAIYNSANSAGSSGQVLTSQGAGAWTWTTPNALPSGTSSHTLTYLSGTWQTSSFLKNNSTNTATGNLKRVDINNDGAGESWPLALNTATKFLVNGRVQMNSTSSTNATTLMGRNGDQEVGTVSVGNGIQLSGGQLSAVKSYLELETNITRTSQVLNPRSKITSIFLSVGLGNDLVWDATNQEIDVLTSGTYEIRYGVNCKSNVSGATVTIDIRNNSNVIYSLDSKHYFNNTNEYCSLNAENITYINSGNSLSMSAFTNTNPTTLSDCRISIIIERIQ